MMETIILDILMITMMPLINTTTGKVDDDNDEIMPHNHRNMSIRDSKESIRSHETHGAMILCNKS